MKPRIVVNLFTDNAVAFWVDGQSFRLPLDLAKVFIKAAIDNGYPVKACWKDSVERESKALDSRITEGVCR